MATSTKEAETAQKSQKEDRVIIGNVLTQRINHRVLENDKHTHMTNFMIPGTGDYKGQWVNASTFGDIKFTESKDYVDANGKKHENKIVTDKKGEPIINADTGKPMKQFSFASFAKTAPLNLSIQVKDEQGNYVQEKGKDGKMHNVYESIGSTTAEAYDKDLKKDRAEFKKEQTKASKAKGGEAR